MELVISNSNGNNLELESPPDSMIMPPGWYMLFILDGPTPSVAKWVQVGGDPAGIGAWPIQSKYSSLNAPSNPLRPKPVTTTNGSKRLSMIIPLFVSFFFAFS